MDPWTIIGTTSAILSFIQFAGQIITTGREVYKSLDGASEANAALGSTISDFQRVFDDLQSKISSAPTADSVAATSTNNRAYAQQNLSQTLTKCQSLGKRISDLLQKTKAAPSSKRDGLVHIKLLSSRLVNKLSKNNNGVSTKTPTAATEPTIFETLKVSVRTVWHKEELDSLRGEWEICLIQFKLDVSHLQTNEDLGSMHLALETHAQQLDEIRGLVSSLVDQGRRPQLVTFLDDLTRADSLPEMENRNAQWILEALTFPGIDARRKQVEPAAASTFQWCVTDDTVPEGHPELKISFRQWLRTGSGVYHITGKPGSGKSTLIKFIDKAAETKQHLEKWADGYRLIRASVYVWKAANINPLQNKFEGLARSLLYQILDAAPKLAAVVFPQHWDPHRFTLLNAMTKGISIPAKLDLEDDSIFDGLRNVLHSTEVGKDYRFFLLVDGMDEFEETNALLHADIVTRIQSLSSANPRGIKICVSSREEAAFMDDRIFKPVERLRLHLVTDEDVWELATQRLIHECSYFTHRKQLWDLIYRIVERAEGVFLWVVLVIREVKGRLVERQSFENLCRAVDLFPSELNDAFVKTLHRIRPAYRIEAWAVFAVMGSLEGKRLFDLFHYSLLQDCLQKTEDKDRCLNEISLDAARLKVQNFIDRIPSLCQGLLELELEARHSNSCLGRAETACRGLQFAHRSVYDFVNDNPDRIAEVLAPEVEATGAELICRAVCRAVEVLPLQVLRLRSSYFDQSMTSGILFRFLGWLIRQANYDSLADHAMRLEILMQIKQNVIPDEEAFQSAAALDPALTVNSVWLFRGALRGRRTDYVNWALDHYPSWVREKTFILDTMRFFFECALYNEPTSALMTLSDLASTQSEHRFDWPINDPFNLELFDIIPLDPDKCPRLDRSVPRLPLKASVWLAMLLLMLQIQGQGLGHRYPRTEKRSFDISRDLYFAAMLESGAETKVQFKWCSQPIVVYRASLQGCNARTKKKNKRTKRHQFKSTRLRLKLLLLKRRDSFRMTVQEGSNPEQVIQDSEWAPHPNHRCILDLFVEEYGDAGCVQLRQVFLMLFNKCVITDSDATASWQASQRENIFRILDEADAKAAAMGVNDQLGPEGTQDSAESGQPATEQEEQLPESDQSIERQEAATVAFARRQITEATSPVNRLVRVLHNWQVTILAVQGATISLLLWHILCT